MPDSHKQTKQQNLPLPDVCTKCITITTFKIFIKYSIHKQHKGIGPSNLWVHQKVHGCTNSKPQMALNKVQNGAVI